MASCAACIIILVQRRLINCFELSIRSYIRLLINVFQCQIWKSFLVNFNADLVYLITET